MIETAMCEIKIKGIYRHFKGDFYIVEDIGTDAETLEPCVIYRSLYGEGALWVRPLDDFMEKVDKVKYPNVEATYKFELQEIESVRDK